MEVNTKELIKQAKRIDISDYVKNDEFTLWCDSYYKPDMHHDLQPHPVLKKYSLAEQTKEPISEEYTEAKVSEIFKPGFSSIPRRFSLDSHATDEHKLIWYHKAAIKDHEGILCIDHDFDYLIFDSQDKQILQQKEKFFLDHHIDDYGLKYCEDSEDLKEAYFDRIPQYVARAPKQILIMQEDEDSIIVGSKYYDRIHLRKHELGDTKWK